jgi:hypothetical protein
MRSPSRSKRLQRTSSVRVLYDCMLSQSAHRDERLLQASGGASVAGRDSIPGQFPCTAETERVDGSTAKAAPARRRRRAAQFCCPGPTNRHRGRSLRIAPLPHNPACGSAPGGSSRKGSRE